MSYYSSAPFGEGYERNAPGDKIEKPIIGIKDIGTSVTEGRIGGGAFRDTIQAAIRSGSNSVELALQMEGGGGSQGTGSYGQDEREELREIARANEVNIMSIHTPSNIGNLSGFNPQQGFDDNTRQKELDEVKKAIEFAADVTDGSAIVIHTGEFSRPISEAKWAKDESGKHIFKAYPEEAEQAVLTLVDQREGRLIPVVRKDMLVHMPKWLTNDKDEYIDYEGNKVTNGEKVPTYNEEKGEFELEAWGWKDFVKESKRQNAEKEEELGRPLSSDEMIKPEEALFRAQLDSQISQYKGLSLQYSQGFAKDKDMLVKLKKAKKHYEELDASLSEEDKWKMMRQDPYSGFMDFVPAEFKPIPEILNKRLKEVKRSIDQVKSTSLSYQQQTAELEEKKRRVTTLEKFAKKKSMQSYVEAGIYAMEKSDLAKTKKPIFVAPENIFPEMGYGSHPEELIELVTDARRNMVEALTKKEIKDPFGKLDESGNPLMVKNRYYRGYSKEKAEKEAKDHIKATFDTSHMGMWWKYFEPRSGENEIQRKKRFDTWYGDQVKKLQKADIIGHVHVVDSFGYGDPHLPIGEGNLPVKTALEYLKEHGYTGTMMSEAHGHGKGGQARQLLKTWQHLGSSIGNLYSAGAPGERIKFGDIHQSYFGQHRAPYTIFGAYAPSNDWTLWTQVPLE